MVQFETKNSQWAAKWERPLCDDCRKLDFAFMSSRCKLRYVWILPGVVTPMRVWEIYEFISLLKMEVSLEGDAHAVG